MQSLQSWQPSHTEHVTVGGRKHHNINIIYTWTFQRVPNRSVTGCQFTIPYVLIGAPTGRCKRISIFIHILPGNFCFFEESPGWWNIITRDTIDLTETGVQGLYRNFPWILVRELFQKKTYRRSEGNIPAAGSSLMWSPPQHETQKKTAKLFNECDSLINCALMLKQWDPSASGFGVGFGYLNTF